MTVNTGRFNLFETYAYVCENICTRARWYPGGIEEVAGASAAGVISSREPSNVRPEI